MANIEQQRRKGTAVQAKQVDVLNWLLIASFSCCDLRAFFDYLNLKEPISSIDRKVLKYLTAKLVGPIVFYSMK